MTTVGGLYQHFKGDYYIVEDVALDCETLERVVIYRNFKTSKLWVRKESDFLSEVDKEKYPNVKQKYRFELKIVIKNYEKGDSDMFTDCGNLSCDFNVNSKCSKPECDNPNYKSLDKNIDNEKMKEENNKNKTGYCKER